MVRRTRRTWSHLIAAVCIVGQACDSPQEPKSGLIVEVLPRFTKAPEIEVVDGLPKVYCFAEIVVRAQGPKDSYVEWRGGEFRLSAGTDRDDVFVTQKLTAELVDYSFGGGRLKPSLELKSNWKFSGNVPFTLTAVYDSILRTA